jgi:D-alanyl-D-alanine carboxypeptidase (penicillin-binding protein 5/6)
MQDKRFADAVATQQIPFPGWGDKPGFIVGNDNPLLYNYDGDLGGKTGYTDDALHTYINAAQRNGSRIVFVGMRGTMSPVTQMYSQSAPMMDYGFALKSSGAQPVGQLVDADPTARPAVTTAVPPAAAQPLTAQPDSHFSIATALAVVALLLVIAGVVFVGMRRRRVG